jgi:AraC-like DNA-binding protein
LKRSAQRRFAVKEALSIEQYCADPVGSWLVGTNYLVWCGTPALKGLLCWGSPQLDHAQTVIRALEARARGIASAASLIDLRRVEAIDPDAFCVFGQYVQSRRAAAAVRAPRQAVLRSGGLAGAAVAGFYEVFQPGHPVRVFTEPLPALAWLGVSGQASVLTQIEAIAARAADEAELLVQLRTHLQGTRGTPAVSSVASALGTSVRSLQRRLRESKTSFQAERNAEQIRRAKKLLRETGIDLKRVAVEVGCSSASAFSALFRRVVGQSPHEWRAGLREEKD